MWTRVRISTSGYVSVEQRLVVVLVLGTVLVFHGRMDMNQRGCKHSDQERGTEYCHANSSHKSGMLFSPDPRVNYRGFSEAQIGALPGHAAPTTTGPYIHVRADLLPAIVDALDRILDGYLFGHLETPPAVSC